MNEVMKLRFIEFAQKSGFCLWKGESWNPGDIVDWSCRYDKELQRFFEFTIRECTKMIREIDWVHDLDSEDYGPYSALENAANGIEEEFGIRERANCESIDIEKLTKSIALECAKVCDEMSTIYKVDPSECADAIRKHFGVE